MLVFDVGVYAAAQRLQHQQPYIGGSMLVLKWYGLAVRRL